MLINLDSLVALYNIQFYGILHVGAHKCEEIKYYDNYLPRDKVLWIEAMQKMVDFSKSKYNDILIECAVISDTKEIVKFNCANNGESSSILDFGLHEYIYPGIKFINSFNVETKLLNEIIYNYDISFNFINLDIQGVELKALKSMEEYLPNIDYIYTEVNGQFVYKDCAIITEIDDFLTKYDFVRIETSWIDDYQTWGDALYIKTNKIPVPVPQPITTQFSPLPLPKFLPIVNKKPHFLKKMVFV